MLVYRVLEIVCMNFSFYFTSTYPLLCLYLSSTLPLPIHCMSIYSYCLVALKTSPCELTRYPSDIPTLGTKHSQAGNEPFPPWEYIRGLGPVGRKNVYPTCRG